MNENYLDFKYKGFYVEVDIIDQEVNGHPEDGLTYTSYVYRSKDEDPIENLIESFDTIEDLIKITKKKIDRVKL